MAVYSAKIAIAAVGGIHMNALDFAKYGQLYKNGRNNIYVLKDQPLVMVVTATAYGMPYGHAQVDKMITDYILPAVMFLSVGLEHWSVH